MCRYADLEQNPDPLVERSVCTETPLLLCPPLPTPSALDCQSELLMPSIKPDLSSRGAFFSPYYLQTLDRFWKGRGLKSIRLSSGFMLISTALELCENVHVYGSGHSTPTCMIIRFHIIIMTWEDRANACTKCRRSLCVFCSSTARGH